MKNKRQLFVKKSRRTIFSEKVFNKHFLKKYASYKNTHNLIEPVPLYVYILLLKIPHKNKGDAVLLYHIFHIYNSIDPQYKTRIVNISIKKIKEITGWGEHRITTTRRILLNLNLIQEIKVRNDQGKFVHHFIQISDLTTDKIYKKFNQNFNQLMEENLRKNRPKMPDCYFNKVATCMPDCYFNKLAPILLSDNNKLLSSNKKKEKIKKEKRNFHSQKNIKSANLDIKEILPSKFQNKTFLHTWLEWEQFRSEIKAKLTPTSIKKQINLLSKFELKEAIAILEQSMANGWRGLFPLKDGISNSKIKTNRLRPNSGLSNARSEEELNELYGRVDITI